MTTPHVAIRPASSAKSWSSLALLLIVLIFGALAFKSASFDLHKYGDSGFDANVLMASENFAKRGFFELKFMPIQVTGPLNRQDEAPYAYGRYPSLPDWIAGLSRKLGVNSLVGLRVTPILFSLFAIISFFELCRRWIGNSFVAFGSAFAYAYNIPFAKMADALHLFAYAEAFHFSSLAAYVAALQARPSKRWVWLIASGVLGFLLSLSSLEYLIFNSLFYGAAPLLLMQGAFRDRFSAAMTYAIPQSACLAAGFVLNFLRNAWYAESIAAALDEYARALVYRMQGAGVDQVDVWSLAVRNYARSLYDFQLSTPLLACVLVSLAYVAIRGCLAEGAHRRLTQLVILGFVLGWSYMLCFPAWTWHHFGFSGIRHLLLFWGLATGGVLMIIPHDVDRALRGDGSVVRKVAACALGLALAIPPFAAAITNARATGALWAGAPQASWSPTFQIVRTLLQTVPTDAVMLGNVFLRPELIFAVNRYAVSVDDSSGVSFDDYSDKTAPRYFLFYQRWGGRDDEYLPNLAGDELAKAQELFAYLSERGTLVGRTGRWSVYRLRKWDEARP